MRSLVVSSALLLLIAVSAITAMPQSDNANDTAGGNDNADGNEDMEEADDNSNKLPIDQCR